ncbi:type II toxin-antitoxin system Phd/YefM family antitoxin [Rhizobium sp. LjRoot254]|uniref:type II toxin-antitoxin system Phd/YefM family antitoxin n=1 Tax=Rhizobium sp. LjRoot254 TaxID=3342297 RepID=UPI003ECC3DFE
MLRVGAAEFQGNIEKYQDIALREPVAVTRNGREGTVLISADEYRHTRGRYRKVMGPDDFTEEDLRAIEEAEIPEEAKAFDHEVED